MRFSILTAAALCGSAFATDHVVVVGKDNLTFVPDAIKAAEGDTVTFKFWPKNHSVAQAAFASPCAPLAGGMGFWSGFIPSSDKAAATTYMYTVTNATKPVWFYCSQGKHCQDGMVGVINGPETGNTLEKFMSASMNATNSTSPVSAAGTGGMIMSNSTTMNSTDMGAASTLSASNGVVFAGLLSTVFYFLL